MLNKKFWGFSINIDKGGNSSPKHFERKCEYMLESLNFVAFTEPNKHKIRSEDFSTTRSNLFSNTYVTVAEF